ncbi:MAG: PIG-L family deacetylase [Flavobacteriaceae bacterium]|nr:PIG-L family deacetylase [Flavobacteriaceae bacterium]
MRKITILICFLLFGSAMQAQKQHQASASEIYHKIKKLNFLGSALYLAAHPDDENTRLISYLSNHQYARTAYLSLTRGDGGQNLIGSELRELLGVLRTQELLAARSVDGGQQFFTRANDFGYSKTPEETMQIWDKDRVLQDVVWVIRNFKPDVIINRFDHRNGRRTHGHHTASAILGVEAFDLAGDKSVYPTQLGETTTWQPKRLFFNTGWWMYGSRENFEKADKSKFVKVDVGVYYPDLGLSNNEIASKASSQHLCQGFGRLSVRGSQPEYVELIKGDFPKKAKDIFAGIDTSWNRVEGGAPIGNILAQIEANFNFKDPASHLPQLMEAYQKINDLKDPHWKAIKLEEIKEIIAHCSGLFLEITAAEAYKTPGAVIELSVEALNRSRAKIKLERLKLLQGNKQLAEKTWSKNLENNQKQLINLSINLHQNQQYTNAYWLNQKSSLGMYHVKDKSMIGKPESPRALVAQLDLKIENSSISLDREVVYRYSKPDKGERYEPFDILPEATVSLSDKVVVFSNQMAKEIVVKVTAHKENMNGILSIPVSSKWKISPEEIEVSLKEVGANKTFVFRVIPPENAEEFTAEAQLQIGKNLYDRSLEVIAYDHIPTQRVLTPAQAKWVRLPIKKAGENIAYIMGAGDAVPQSLEQIGYRVVVLDPEEIELATLKKYDAIVMGIRAYNVVEELKFKQQTLLDYVKQGGTMVVQYNTANRWARQFENIAPYPLTLSRDRVTEETASIRILEPSHPVMMFPNVITKSDFEGWVQERGLYFPNKWDKAFTPIFSMKDKGESTSQGSLLIANYGKGVYVYTGLSFFRELPAGVPGAYKLFANILSLGNKNMKQPIKN